MPIRKPVKGPKDRLPFFTETVRNDQEGGYVNDYSEAVALQLAQQTDEYESP